jgi:hypothetical protein
MSCMRCDTSAVFVICSGKSPVERKMDTVVVQKVCFWVSEGDGVELW